MRRSSASVKGIPVPSGDDTMQRKRSTVTIGSGAAVTASASRRLSASPSVTGREHSGSSSKKMSPKLGAMTQRMPNLSSAQTACSRELPQPKFSRDEDARAAKGRPVEDEIGVLGAVARSAS